MAIQAWDSDADSVNKGLAQGYISTPGGTGVRPSEDQTAAITAQATDPQASKNVVNNSGIETVNT
jgi:hypothetical protein